MAFGAKIQITADRSSAGKSAFNASVKELAKNSKAEVKISALELTQEVINKAFENKQATLTVKKINVDAAIRDVQKQLSEMLSHLSVSNGVSISGLVNYSGGDNLAKQAEKNASSYEKETAALETNKAKKKQAAQANADYVAGLKTIESHLKNAKKAYEQAFSADPKKRLEDKKVLDGLIAQYNQLTEAEVQYKANAVGDSGAVEAIIEKSRAIVELVANMQAATRAEAEQEKQTERTSAANKRAEAQNASLSKSIASQYNTVSKYIGDNPKAMNNSAFASTLSNIQTQLANAKAGVVQLDRTQLNNLMTEFRNVQGQINAANASGQTFIGMVQKLYEKFGGWYLISQSFTYMVRTFKQMAGNVRELDAAMTELKKVTDATSAAYDAFFEGATERATKVGATLTDTITASADFARLGYSMSEAAELADAALIYKNVGDGITDVSTASEYLISTMKAFGVEASDVMSIVDRFNQVGNEYAISSSGLGEALQRSASALAAAGNTLEESIGLAVGMNNVLQNPDKVGTVLQTASMYLRAAKTEAEEAGESTDGMANSVSELRDELLKLSGVDVMLDDSTFKSTYEIYKELAEVWKDLADVDQANILELIGGKRNANASAALLTNFEQAESAMKSAMNSSGSALAENEKYLDSINGKLSQLSATFESLSAHVVNSDIAKVVLDIANGVMNGIDWLAKANALLPTLIVGFGAIKTVVGPEGGSAATTSIPVVTRNEQAA